jgi:hypothetical protein
LTGGNTPSFLQSVTTGKTVHGSEGMMNAAKSGPYFTSQAAADASTAGIGANSPDGVLTFVDGERNSDQVTRRGKVH